MADNWFRVGEVTRDISLCVNQLPTAILGHSDAGPNWLVSDGSAGHFRIDPALADGTLAVFDASGRPVLQRTARGPIDLNGLSDGIHVVTLRSADGGLRYTRLALVR